MSRIKTFIILIIVFLIIGGYLYYKWGKESFMPSNENIIALNLEKVGKPIYIKARNWGVAGNTRKLFYLCQIKTFQIKIVIISFTQMMFFIRLTVYKQ
ncbi:hypothetical protein [Hoylesella shahii]|uniref:hypothetical protein n=1 Tax=Hoylesella shahii TaxID=228603 RepID=UPI0028E51139|nr:hypothetical protein [Hoylesella shahii]